MAMYQPFIFAEIPEPDVPKQLHQIGVTLDARIKRHQIITIFRSSSDIPVSGGNNTFQLGAGWGYESIRKPHVSLILGGVLAVKDSGIALPSGDPWLLMPLPLIRFGIDTRWFTSSFDFISGPYFNFTVAPKERIRLTCDMGMETFRSIADLNCEFTLWYRLFSENHKLGDFAGIGAGFKNELTGFDLSDGIKADTFELQQSSVFAAIDLSFLTIQGGWIIDSNYLLDGKRTGSPGSGFFLSVQGMIPVYQKKQLNKKGI
jgi:hypothetical protein